MSEELSVESRISPPSLSCPRCDNLLPPSLGELKCSMCGAEVKIDHPVTKRKWREEKVGCPNCSKVLIAGVDRRPANLQCASCDTHFELRANRPKIEISCPSCERKLRMNTRPGEREITCPACETEFKINF